VVPAEDPGPAAPVSGRLREIEEKCDGSDPAAAAVGWGGSAREGGW